MTTLPEIGQSITFRKTMTVAEQGFFTGISGNMGRAYVDRVHARAAGFEDMVVFELAAASLLTTAYGRLAGPNFRLGELSLSFAKAFSVGASLAATATVTAASDEAITVSLETTLDGVTVQAGQARLVPVGLSDV